jgi:glycosyltransferase involved in cell wall biosynthesis
MKCHVIIPFYNEAHLLGRTIEILSIEAQHNAFARSAESIHFVWADDGSSDRSFETLKGLLEITFPLSITHEVIRSEQNRGKGSVVRFAMDHMRSTIKPDDIVAFWDADGELDPKGLFEGLQIIGSGAADIVFGSRFSKRNTQVLNFRHYLGNKTLTLFSNFFSNLNLSDVHCCARMVRAGLLFLLPLSSRGFDLEAEFAGLVGRVRKPQLRIHEIPIEYVPRTVQEGKKIRLSHVFPQLVQAIRCRFFHKEIVLEESLNQSGKKAAISSHSSVTKL